ncbi:MAG TPA: DOPA 4,5-dioxygenase family protein [Acetobacteraceae bacterium]|nr:DOPA 4,5-dioxygenase family protein [Acetobacteraceae bacterium]
MDKAPSEITAITEYHAHVYYDPADEESRARAGTLRAWVEARFPVRMGRWHDVPVGPHPGAMYQIAFAPKLFPDLAPFLMLNRMGLTVLIHPETGRPRDDHTHHAAWLGEALPLKTEILPESDH